MRKVGIFAVLVGLMVLGFALAAVADGDGSPDECKTGQQMTGTDDLQEFDAPYGYVVTGVCIKAGQLHTGVLGNGVGVCYTVAGVGTSSASVTRTGEPGPDCQEISHVDVLGTTTTTTSAPEETTTTVPDETTTTTQVVEETTTTVVEATTTTDPGEITTTASADSSITSPPPADPGDPIEELPYTGAGSVAGLVLAASGLIAGGVRLVKGKD